MKYIPAVAEEMHTQELEGQIYMLAKQVGLGRALERLSELADDMSAQANNTISAKALQTISENIYREAQSYKVA